MLTGCLDDVCIHTMPCGGRETFHGDPGQAARARPGWAGGVSVGAGPSGTVPNPPTSARRCCWRSCALPSAQPTRPPSTSFTTCWPAPTAPCGELGGVRARPLARGVSRVSHTGPILAFIPTGLSFTSTTWQRTMSSASHPSPRLLLWGWVGGCVGAMGFPGPFGCNGRQSRAPTPMAPVALRSRRKSRRRPSSSTSSRLP